MTIGTEAITRERQRQIEQEGYGALRDREYALAQLALAAAAYALYAARQIQHSPNLESVPIIWPWGAYAWNPSHDPRRNLEKAGALIAAEIDRMSQPDKAR